VFSFRLQIYEFYLEMRKKISRKNFINLHFVLYQPVANFSFAHSGFSSENRVKGDFWGTDFADDADYSSLSFAIL